MCVFFLSKKWGQLEALGFGQEPRTFLLRFRASSFGGFWFEEWSAAGAGRTLPELPRCRFRGVPLFWSGKSQRAVYVFLVFFGGEAGPVRRHIDNMRSNQNSPAKEYHVGRSSAMLMSRIINKP